MIEAIRRLIAAERDKDPDGLGSGWIEVGRFAGVDPRTIKALEKAGLVETGSDDSGRHTIARFARVLPKCRHRGL